MAYRLKIIHYQNKDRHILLQNENGPCPLLAAANALLLRGDIDLPSAAIRTGAASIDDVVNILADFALSRHTGRTEFHLDELLSVFPTLQYGMDVNPKFNCGPTGVEYTSNLNAYDCLHVELVHGWLADPQDQNTCLLIGNKTYNELIELVIEGNEASGQLERLAQEIADATAQLELAKVTKLHQQNASPTPMVVDDSVRTTPIDPPGVIADEGWVQVASTIPTTATANLNPVDYQHSREAATPPILMSGMEADLQIKMLTDRLEQLRQKERELTSLSMKSMQIDHFLTSTSHQLTHAGLLELYAKVKEGELCVFFRNNHFSTMTKHDGMLYLLVTDFGYANVPDVVWEKLDAIDGDTEYVSSHFKVPAPQTELLPSGMALSPEQLLAQRGQTEADYQLALRLSQDPNAAVPTRRNLDDEEGRLMAAATELSLREFNGLTNPPTPAPTTAPPAAAGPTPAIPSAPPDTEDNLVPSPLTVGVTPPPVATNGVVLSSAQEDADKAYAMQLQAEWQSELVAQRLAQQEEQRLLAASRRRQQQQQGTRPIRPATTAAGGGGGSSSSGSGSNSGCVIS